MTSLLKWYIVSLRKNYTKSNRIEGENNYGLQNYHLPLIITENGCCVPDKLEEDGTIHDDYRIDYLR